MTTEKEFYLKKKGIYMSVLIYPLWSLFLSFKYFRTSQAKNLFWLFCIFLGMIHTYFPEGNDAADGYRYAQQLIELNQKPVIWENFSSSFYEDGAFVDVYQPTITYLLSIVTNNPRWLFLVFALVFGFFYSRNIWFVLERFPKYIGTPLVILMLYYMLICPIWEINGVRMWTALHVFVYGALPYLFNADKSKIIWCFAALLVHFSFFLPLIILLLYHFSPKYINFFLIFYLLSFFIKELDLEQIKTFLLSYSPSFLYTKANYASEQFAQEIIEANSVLNFYVTGSQTLVRWAITILLFFSCIFGKSIIKNHKPLLNLMCFSLFIYAISNILSLIPSVGRFVYLSQMFAFVSVIFFYIFYMQIDYRQIKIIAIIFRWTPVMLFLSIIVQLRMGCEYYGISLFFNPIAVLFIEDNQPVIQFIKSIF